MLVGASDKHKEKDLLRILWKILKISMTALAFYLVGWPVDPSVSINRRGSLTLAGPRSSSRSERWMQWKENHHSPMSAINQDQWWESFIKFVFTSNFSCQTSPPPARNHTHSSLTDHRNMFHMLCICCPRYLLTKEVSLWRGVFIFSCSRHCLVFWWIMFSLAEKANFPSLLGSAGQIFAAIRAGGWRPPTSCFCNQLTGKTFSVSRVSVLDNLDTIYVF